MTKHREWTKILEPTAIEEFLIKLQIGSRNKKIIGQFYKLCIDMNPSETLQIKEKWENEMNIGIHQDRWEEICTVAH